MMENGKKLEFPEGQEGVRVNQGFPLSSREGYSEAAGNRRFPD
jgi:hypothetical protein